MIPRLLIHLLLLAALAHRAMVPGGAMPTYGETAVLTMCSGQLSAVPVAWTAAQLDSSERCAWSAASLPVLLSSIDVADLSPSSIEVALTIDPRVVPVGTFKQYLARAPPDALQS